MPDPSAFGYPRNGPEFYLASNDDNALFSRFSLTEVLPILRANRWLILLCTVGAFSIAFVGTMLTTKQYQATSVLQLNPSNAKEVNVADVVDMDVRGIYETERFYRTELSVMRTRTTALEVIRRYNDLQYDDLDIEKGVPKLLGMLTVSPRERSSLIEISITHKDPHKAAILSTLYAQSYVDLNLESRRSASREAKAWLETKIEEYEVKVAGEAAELIEFKRRHDVVDLEDDITAVSARMDQIDTRYGRVSTDRILVATQIAGYDALLRQEKVAEIAEVLGTPNLLALSAIYAEARTDHATIGARYGERHSRYQESEATLQRIYAELRREVGSAVDSKRARLELLVAEETSLLDEIELVQESMLTRQGYQAEFDQKRLGYERSEAFLRRLALRSDELALSSRTQLNNALLREPARVPERPSSPNLFLNLFVGLFVGAGAGFGLAFLRHSVDDTINNPEDVANFLDAPFLGMVPRVDVPEGASADLITYTAPRSLAAESVRGIRALLEMNPSGTPVKRLLVTSAVASEGKTSMCVRIGIAYAQFGRRVLVIDADHHRPRVHKVFQKNNTRGVLDIMRGESSIEGTIETTEVPDMDFMPLGTRGQDAAKLFASDAFAGLADELQGRYDLVIVDTPPSATLSEAIQLSPLADGVVFVVRAGKVSRRVVRHTIDRFKKVNARILGVVLNDVEPIATGAYGYLYGYKYGYGPYGAPEDEQSGDDKAVG
ncbi:MAG: succinoglycan biosynthesis transport protein ExoP [Myxococcota bacterium]